MTTHAQRAGLGAFGERLAEGFLTDAGFRVLDRNWRCSDGEIDIVAADGDELVVCEVKTRTSSRYGTPVEAISPDKAVRLRRLGARWAVEHGLAHVRRRVDVVAIDMSLPSTERIDHRRAVV